MSGAYALNITLGADIIEILGILDMNNNRITNVGSPVTTTDAATKAYVDSLGSPGGEILDMNNNRITNVGPPVTTADAATKAYVDSSNPSGTDTLALLGCDMDQVPRWDGTVWVCSSLGIEDYDLPSIVDNGGIAGQYSSIAIGTDNNPVISYFQIQWLKVAHCGNESCSAGNTITTVDSTDAVGKYSSIAIGADNNPVISYYDSTNGALKVTHCGNASCSAGNTITTVDSPGVGTYTSIAIGADNNPVISYYDFSNGALKVAHCGNESCSAGNTITTVDSTGIEGTYTSIAIGTDNNPVISYYDSTNDDLKVAHCGNASCSTGNTITTVDSIGDVGRYTSIAIGVDGNPVISYFDDPNGDLKMAHCGNESCSDRNSIRTVDILGNVGLWSSIAIGADSTPKISYYDGTMGDLKVTDCIGIIYCVYSIIFD